MAAILPFMETEEFHFPDIDDRLDGLGAEAAFDQAETEEEKQILARSNSELSRLLWNRSVLNDSLAGVSFTLVFIKGELKIRLGSKIPPDVVPWSAMQSGQRTFSFFSSNSKMRCPTFDLPAGGVSVGGSCVAAEPAQTISLANAKDAGNILAKRDGRVVLKVFPDVSYNRARTVCGSCYATGGSFVKTSVQLAEAVHLAVMKTAVSPGNERMREQLVQAIVWSIPRLPYDELTVGGDKEEPTDEEKAAGKKTKAKTAPGVLLERMARIPHNVIRIHSSGDFFSPAYANLWLDVARRIYEAHGTRYLLWAPTRTHCIEAWSKWWKTKSIPPNFIIRPSAYHIGDPAPEWSPLSSGTSVLTENDSIESKGVKYDHQCNVYDLDDDQDRTCVEAKDPDGKLGCRACWTRPELRVNYVQH